jgi:DNA-binding transcriptional LysR family regulator
VSKFVSRLEEKFGVRLFNRTTHEVRLSEEGNLFLKNQKILETMRDAEVLKENFSSSPAGRLIVYSLPSFALSQLSIVLPAFLKAYPDIRVDIQLGTESINSVTSDVGVVLRYGHVEDSALICRRIADSQWVICASPDYLAQYGAPETPKDLVRHNCLSFSLKTMRIPWSLNNPTGTIILKAM